MVTKTVWKAGSLEPLKIILDVLNPRVEIDKNATQDQLRIKLLELEDVLDLARNIEKNNGLFYGERIITTSISGKQTVLEGNRRVAACQMLLQPSLVPASYKMRFPVATVATRTNLKKILVDIAPSRAAAEPILTKRHTEQGAKPWSPVAKMRRAVRLLDNNSVEAVAQILGTSIAQVNKLIQPYQLLKYAINLNVWTIDERKILEGEKLTTNPYTRFFTLAKTKQILQTHFDENKNIVSALPASVFKVQMARIARDFLLPDPANQNRPRCTTRTNPEEYFASFVNSIEGQVSAKKAIKLKKDEKIQADNKPENNIAKSDVLVSKKLKASIFFENLECHIQDDKLIKLTNEIKGINHTRMPIAASLLTRALFECALVYKVQKEKKWKQLINAEGRDPGLAEIIKYVGNFDNGIFAENNICKTLKSHTTTEAKNYLDAMTHLKYQEADSTTLETVANNLRQIIQYILKDN